MIACLRIRLADLLVFIEIAKSIFFLSRPLICIFCKQENWSYLYKWSLVWVYKNHRKQKTRKTLFRPVTSYHHFWNLSLLKMKKKFKSFCCWKSWESQIRTWIFDRNCTKQGPQVSLLWISIVSIFPLINPPEFSFFLLSTEKYIIWFI